MSTITALVGTDGITTANSMTKINTNFSNLNTDKIETSTLDTDTTLAANSDSKIATQKAVKAYVDAGGNVNASETTKGIVEEATDAEVTAGTSTGATGAKLFITPTKLATYLSGTTPVVRTYTTTSTYLGDSTTQFDITNPSGTTFRFTYDGTGTNPNITSSNPAIGDGVNIQASNFSAGNLGSRVVTASGTNYFEVTIATGGVAENNKTIGTGFIAIGTKWTKPTGLKYIVVEVQGAGGGSGSSSNSVGASSGGASAGGYSKKLVSVSSLASTEVVTVGAKGIAGVASDGTDGKPSSFGTFAIGYGGLKTTRGGSTGATSSSSTGGDINIPGQNGTDSFSTFAGGIGGDSFYGKGGTTSVNTGKSATGYGAGAGGAFRNGSEFDGGNGSDGIVIVTEYYA